MFKIRVFKIKAFTLSEMIVTIIITLIVVGLAFAVLTLVKKQMYGLESNLERQTDVNLFRQALWGDFKNYPFISFDAQNDILTFENEINTVVYELAPEYCVREKDTFMIAYKTREFFFDGVKVESGNVDAIKLLTDKEVDMNHIFVHKKNAANLYIK